jgi:hypothetical protein
MSRYLHVCVGLAAAAAAVAGLVGPAEASIIGTLGSVMQISPPPSAQWFAFSGPIQKVWNEKTGVVLTNQAVDQVANPGTTFSPVPGTLNGKFDSHFLHMNRLLWGGAVIGRVTFSSTIVGLAYSRPLLDQTDASSGALGTIYPTGYTNRGLQTTGNGWVTVNGNVLTFQFLAVTTNFWDAIDQVRVFTKVVPGPGSVFPLLAGVGMAVARRRRGGG